VSAGCCGLQRVTEPGIEFGDGGFKLSHVSAKAVVLPVLNLAGRVEIFILVAELLDFGLLVGAVGPEAIYRGDVLGGLTAQSLDLLQHGGDGSDDASKVLICALGEFDTFDDDIAACVTDDMNRSMQTGSRGA
jgi:hypothetical protein